MAVALELRAAYEGFHPDVRAVLEACHARLEPANIWKGGGVPVLRDGVI